MFSSIITSKPLFWKLVFATFHFFQQIIALKQLWKCFLFHLKNYFRSQDFQVFVFLSSSFFPYWPLLKGWSKINLKIYDVNQGFLMLKTESNLTCPLALVQFVTCRYPDDIQRRLIKLYIRKKIQWCYCSQSD